MNMCTLYMYDAFLLDCLLNSDMTDGDTDVETLSTYSAVVFTYPASITAICHSTGPQLGTFHSSASTKMRYSSRFYLFLDSI